jgi:carboxyl-terminal processing protease
MPPPLAAYRLSRQAVRKLRAVAVSLCWGLGIVAVTGGCATTTRDAQPTAPPYQAQATFDEVWQAVADENVAALREGVDWNAIRDEFTPQVAKVRSNDELRSLLESMLARLGKSHFGIIPGSLASAEPNEEGSAAERHAGHSHHANDVHESPGTHENQGTHDGHEEEQSEGGGDLGIWFRRVGTQILTVAPRPGGAADRAGIGAGWELRAVDGRAVRVPVADLEPLERTLMASPPKPGDAMRRYRAESAAASIVSAVPGQTLALRFRDAEGRERDVTLRAEAERGEIVEFGNLPPMSAYVESRIVGDGEWKDAGFPAPAGRIGYIAFNLWMVGTAIQIDQAIDRFRDCDAIIVDLRGNPGGVGGLAMGIGGHFLGEPKNLGTMSNRGGAIEFRVNPRRVSPTGERVEPYAGPLVILLDPLSASTSEIFAAGLQELGRATVIGQTSAGAALPSIARRLPNGDVLQMAVADFVTPNGNRIEGAGVTPNVVVELSQPLLATERDPTLAAALRHLSTPR